MEINLFTFVAQIINFLILVALLRHFLYGRIIKAMDDREEKIASRIKESEQKEKEAEEKVELYLNKKKELDSQKEEIFSQAKKDAELKRKEMMEKIQEEVSEKKKKWYESVQKQRDSFVRNLRQQTAVEVYSIVRQILKDLANDDIEQHMIDTFIERIRSADKKEKDEIAGFAREAKKEIAIFSAFEISEEMREEITRVVKKEIVDDVNVQFKISPDLICGIELRGNNRKISWSVDDYLRMLEEKVSKSLEEMKSGDNNTENSKSENLITKQI